MAKMQRTTAESTRFRVDADCYGHAGHGYVKKGEFIEVPKGTPVSQTWTEVDENGEAVEGGFKSKKVSRHIERPDGDEEKSFADIGDDEAVDSSAAPTPPSPAAKPAKPKKAPAAKPAKPS